MFEAVDRILYSTKPKCGRRWMIHAFKTNTKHTSFCVILRVDVGEIDLCMKKKMRFKDYWCVYSSIVWV